MEITDDLYDITPEKVIKETDLTDILIETNEGTQTLNNFWIRLFAFCLCTVGVICFVIILIFVILAILATINISESIP